METSRPADSFGASFGSRGTSCASSASRDGARHLKKSPEHFPPAELKGRHKFMAKESCNYPVKALAEAVKVSRSSYHPSLTGREEEEEKADDAASVAGVFRRHPRRAWLTQGDCRVEGGRRIDRSPPREKVDDGG